MLSTTFSILGNPVGPLSLALPGLSACVQRFPPSGVRYYGHCNRLLSTSSGTSCQADGKPSSSTSTSSVPERGPDATHLSDVATLPPGGLRSAKMCQLTGLCARTNVNIVNTNMRCPTCLLDQLRKQEQKTTFFPAVPIDKTVRLMHHRSGRQHIPSDLETTRGSHAASSSIWVAATAGPFRSYQHHKQPASRAYSYRPYRTGSVSSSTLAASASKAAPPTGITMPPPTPGHTLPFSSSSTSSSSARPSGGSVPDQSIITPGGALLAALLGRWATDMSRRGPLLMDPWLRALSTSVAAALRCFSLFLSSLSTAVSGAPVVAPDHALNFAGAGESGGSGVGAGTARPTGGELAAASTPGLANATNANKAFAASTAVGKAEAVTAAAAAASAAAAAKAATAAAAQEQSAFALLRSWFGRTQGRLKGISRKFLFRTLNKRIVRQMARRATIGFPIIGFFFVSQLMMRDLARVRAEAAAGRGAIAGLFSVALACDTVDLASQALIIAGLAHANFGLGPGVAAALLAAADQATVAMAVVSFSAGVAGELLTVMREEREAEAEARTAPGKQERA